MIDEHWCQIDVHPRFNVDLKIAFIRFHVDLSFILDIEYLAHMPHILEFAPKI